MYQFHSTYDRDKHFSFGKDGTYELNDGGQNADCRTRKLVDT